MVEKLLPLIEIGKQQIAGAVEPTAEERERAAEAAHSARASSLKPADTAEADEEAKKFGTAEVDYIYEQPPRSSSTACCRSTFRRCCFTP